MIELDIDLPPRVMLGEPVPITITVRNTGDKPAAVYLTGRPVAFDIEITASDGSPVWNRLKGEIVAAILQVVELEPDGELEFRDDWDQVTNEGLAAEPGMYTVVGKVVTDEPGKPLVSAPKAMEIVAPHSTGK